MRRRALPGLLFGWLLACALPARADVDDRMKEVKRACAAGEVDKAIRLLADLYAETNDPIAIYNQARCYQGNGQPERAATRFREYLRRATGLSPRERAEVEAFIREAEAEAARAAPARAPAPPARATGQPAPYPYESPPPNYPARTTPPRAAAPATAPYPYESPPSGYPARTADLSPPPPVRKSRRKGLLIAGAVTLGASYLISLAGGLSIREESTCGADCQTASVFFMVPVIGPWGALATTNRDEDKGAAALLGTGQAVGLTLGIIGLSRYIADGKAISAAGAGPLEFAVLPTRGGAFGLCGARF